jgi:hypothetical protein
MIRDRNMKTKSPFDIVVPVAFQNTFHFEMHRNIFLFFKICF